MALGKIKAVTVAGLAALTLGGGMLAAAAPAEARPWGYRVGFQRGAFHGGPGFYRPYYRPAFYGGYYRRPYYRPYGGAVAAGLVGGLALGALAASSTYATPYYASLRSLTRLRLWTGLHDHQDALRGRLGAG